MKVNPLTQCWESTFKPDKAGYAYIRVEGRNVLVHRASFAEFKGSPTGFMVCHSCDNRRCFNPEHLWLGDQDDNMQDMIQKGRARWQK